MSDPPKRIVQAGYDAIGEHYLDWSRTVEGDPRDRFLTELAQRLPDGSRVLDLGCGAGVPSTERLAERFEHARLFGKIVPSLRPGRLFLASLGAGGSPDWTGEWLGVPMFFSSHDADTNRRLLQAAGLALVLDEVVPMEEPEGEVAFLWVLAQKSVS